MGKIEIKISGPNQATLPISETHWRMLWDKATNGEFA